MPILMQDDKMVLFFGKGDIVFSGAHDLGTEDKPENNYVAFFQSEKPFEIDKPLPELYRKQVDNWAIKMYFPKKESLDSLINFLTEFRESQFKIAPEESAP